MRKTFVVGRLNRRGASIVMLTGGSSTPCAPARALGALLARPKAAAS